MNKKTVKLATPWVIYFNEIEAMFKEDPEVRAEYDSENYTIRLYVDDPKKAEAIEQLLPVEKKYGNITVKTVVIPANKLSDSKSSLFRKAFKNNPAVVGITTIDTPFGNETFVIFRKTVVQYHNDDLFDINGVCSTLYQDIAKDLFAGCGGVHFCTDVE